MSMFYVAKHTLEDDDDVIVIDDTSDENTDEICFANTVLTSIGS